LTTGATFVDWEQPATGALDWQEAHRRLVADGQASSLAHATETNRTRDFPAPVVP
jgi:hypothetical protein